MWERERVCGWGGERGGGGGGRRGRGGRGFKGTDPSINISPTHALQFAPPISENVFFFFNFFHASFF
jgi:hypothetical protein